MTPPTPPSDEEQTSLLERTDGPEQTSELEQTNEPEPPPRVRQRREHTKSRGGCLTCKQRRVKCDQKKPTW